MIARRLWIAESTIKTHLTRIYKKTGSLNRVQATRHYLDRYHGVAPAPPAEPPAPRDTGAVDAASALIARQIRQLETRLDRSVPGSPEADRLERALDALRGVAADPAN